MVIISLNAMQVATWLLLFLNTVLIVAGDLESCESAELREEIREFDYDSVKQPTPTLGLLYPRESTTREVRSLNGIWRFLKSSNTDPDKGIREEWYKKGLENLGLQTIPMPVPASYNDITTDQELRDHVGTVWYERTFTVSPRWKDSRFIWLRFGSVSYSAQVWVNGKFVLKHDMGHLPFEVSVHQYLEGGIENRVTVLCDNRLSNHTVPQGKVYRRDDENVQTYTFDFFNYAGIHRSVHLHTTPMLFINDVALTTDVEADGMGVVNYRVSLGTGGGRRADSSSLIVKLYNKKGDLVVEKTTHANKRNEGQLEVANAILWWPYLMHEEPGYMYTLEFVLSDKKSEPIDVYRLPVGIRSLTWDKESLKINHKPVYLQGFGKHEDADIRGKGFDYALLTRDFNLLQWVGANAYRTSHYPYSEESMQFADEHGIMVIDECSSVYTDIFEPELLQNHMSAIEQLIHRDRNHASVIAWSIAAGPMSTKKASDPYFSHLANYTRSIAQGRPLTASTHALKLEDYLPQYLDIVGFNYVNDWYKDTGRTDTITRSVIDEALNLYEKYERPIVMFEYGADTVEGYHALPSFVSSEEYQSQLLGEHFKAFDALRKNKWFIGEFLSNFADFKTPQKVGRVGGNKNGIFTRERELKSAALMLRQRYQGLGAILYNRILPDDVLQFLVE